VYELNDFLKKIYTNADFSVKIRLIFFKEQEK